MITAALIPAAGRGQRMGIEIEKQFLQLMGKPLLAYTLARFEATPTIDRIVLIVPAGRETFCYQEIVAPGGDAQSHSHRGWWRDTPAFGHCWL